MNQDPNDNRLRARFEALRAEDEAQAPDFADMVAKARDAAVAEPAPVRSLDRWRGRWTLLGGGLAAAAAVVLMLIGPGDRLERDFDELVTAFAEDPALGGWQSPTDGLLDVPGNHLVTTIPTIGGFGPLTTSNLGPNPQVDTL